MNRMRALTLDVVDQSKLSAAQQSTFMGLVFSGQVEMVFPGNRAYVKEGIDITELLLTGAFEVVDNFPRIYELVDAAIDEFGIWLLDNTSKYIALNSIADLQAATIENCVSIIPDETTLVTEEFIDDLSTKTALVAWIEARHLEDEDEIDTDILKADLFQAVKSYFGVGIGSGHSV